MRWDMEILSPSSYFSNSSWSSKKWTAAENKAFENALALFDENAPDRWQRVAEMVPGKTVGDVIRQYKELVDDISSIEAGLFPVPGYSTSSPSSSSLFTLEWGGHGYAYEGVKQCYVAGGSGRKSRPSEQERKKGIPWTEQEHKLFLMGLKKHGKGDWRNISRNFVITRTPTQVASHAQKYFIRQLSGGKDKRRASIHDITTVNLNEQEEDDHTKKQLPELPDSNQKHNHPSFQSSHQAYNMFTPPPYGVNAYGLIKMHGHESFLGSQNMAFQMQSGLHFPN